MEPASWGFIGTITGTIVGATASIYATYLNGKNIANNQKSTENFQREELFREFQRDNLLKLQDEFSVGMRLIGRTYVESLKNYKKNNDWNSFELSEEVNIGLGNTFGILLKLTERVSNDQLRKKIIEMRKDMSSFIVDVSVVENNGFLRKLSDKFELLMIEIGIELRNNY